MFPKAAVGSVVGFGGMVGSAGGVLLQLLAGRMSYVVLYAIAGSSYVIALADCAPLSPRLAPGEAGLNSTWYECVPPAPAGIAAKSRRG